MPIARRPTSVDISTRILSSCHTSCILQMDNGNISVRKTEGSTLDVLAMAGSVLAEAPTALAQI